MARPSATNTMRRLSHPKNGIVNGLVPVSIDLLFVEVREGLNQKKQIGMDIGIPG